jgi:prevent-host-death family protein
MPIVFRVALVSAFEPDLYNDHVYKKLTATEVKAKILALLDEVADGGEVEITKHGRTVARLVPAAGPHALRGSLVGVAMTAAEDEDLFTTGADWNLP